MSPMPINPIVLQRRHTELGRIRLGVKAPIQRGGTRPSKLDRFRFTSPNERLIADVATLYGGKAQPWDNNGKPEHEVITEATGVPVIVLRGGMSQWMETWTGGGCVHRCDGVHDVITDTDCNPDDPRHANAKPTTRLSVMLTELEAIGVWRLETHGWNAAAELPNLVEIAQTVGDLVPARLVLHERRAIVDGKTSRFVVPGLDLEVTPRQLVALSRGETVEAIGAGPSGSATPGAPMAVGGGSEAPAAIGSAAHRPTTADDLLDTLVDLIGDARTTDDLNAVWRRAGEAGILTDDLKARIIERGGQLSAEAAERAADAPDPEPTIEPDSAEDADAPIDRGDVEATPDADDPIAVDDAWAALVQAAGRAGLSEPDLRAAFLDEYGHGVESATVSELDDLRVTVTTGEKREA